MIPTLAEAADAIAHRRLSPVELVRGCLERIAALDSTLHSHVHVRADAALAEAGAAAREIAQGRYRGALHGIPVGLKDIVATAGIPTTGNSRLRLGHVPAASAAVHERLRRAGAILIGKHATHEFALGGPSFDLPFPPARNPWDPARFTGGSSSGSAAAVAAGLCLGAVGTDTSGSIRAPAAYCGVAGLKPTRGRVSFRGIFPLSPTQDHAGPMAWTVADCALLLGVLAGPDPGDPQTLDTPVPDYAAALGGDLRGLRIGVARRWQHDELALDPAVHAALDEAAATLAGLGAIVADADLPPLADFHAAAMAIALQEAFAEYGADLATRRFEFGRLFRARVLLGALVRDSDVAAAFTLRSHLVAALDAALARHDAVLAPAVSGPAPPLDSVRPYYFLESPGTMAPACLTGVPALALCCGFADGLPLGLQLMGPRLSEPTLLRIGDAYERATPWRRRRPGIRSERGGVQPA